MNGVSSGAAYGIMNPYLSSGKGAWDTAVQNAARAEMTNQTGYVSTDLTVAPPVVTVEASGQRRIRVTATYKYFNTIITWPGIPSQMELDAVVEMRVIR